MKGKLLLFGLLVLAVMLSGCSSLIARECGEDTECFGEALGNCTPAIFEKETVVLIHSVVRYEILGRSESGCEIQYKITKPATGSVIGEGTCIVADYEKGEDLLELGGLVVRGCRTDS